MMTKIKKQDESGSAYEKMIQERIGQAVWKDEEFDGTLTVAQLEAWVEEDRRKKTTRHKPWLSIAMCTAFICVFSLTMKYFVYTDPIVEAGKESQTVTKEVNGGAVIKNNGEGDQDNIGERSEIHTTWEAVLASSKKYSDMVLPGEMPEAYTFEKLEIVTRGTVWLYKYSYRSASQDKINISEVFDDTATVITGYDEKRRGESGRNIYFYYDDGSITATVRIGALTISVTGAASEDDMIDIIDNLKRGR